jgi:hypothetical protein
MAQGNYDHPSYLTRQALSVSSTAGAGSITGGSSTVGATSVSTDMNVRLLAGAVLAIKNGTDASGTADLEVESYLDPEATWTGPNN